MAVSPLIKVSLLLCLAVGASAQLFPCVSTLPCMDDPGFMSGGIFPCDSMVIDVCVADAAALVSCPLTCGTCTICEDPDPVPGFGVIFQSAEVVPGELTVYIDTTETVAGIQGILSCLDAMGQITSVDIDPSSTLSSAAAATGLTLSFGTEGKFLIVDFSGGSISPSYLQLGTFIPDTSPGSNITLCQPGTLNFGSVIVSDPLGMAIPECGAIDVPCMVASPPPALASVRSDPHMQGLRGQNFDFTGQPGEIYALIHDENIHVNTRFEIAYATGGDVKVFTPTTAPVKTKGTWIAAMGVKVASDMLAVSVDDNDGLGENDDGLDMCSNEDMRTLDGGCFIGGFVYLNGKRVSRVGEFAGVDVTVTLTNSKSYGRIKMTSDVASMTIDYVPPPSAWEVPMIDSAAYSHLNMKIERIVLTEDAHGVLGYTQKLTYDSEGKPIMSSSGANGESILPGTYEDYRVPSLFCSKFSFSDSTDGC